MDKVNNHNIFLPIQEELQRWFCGFDYESYMYMYHIFHKYAIHKLDKNDTVMVTCVRYFLKSVKWYSSFFSKPKVVHDIFLVT